MGFWRNFFCSEEFQAAAGYMAAGLVVFSTLDAPFPKQTSTTEQVRGTKEIAAMFFGAGLALAGWNLVRAGMRRYEEGPEQNSSPPKPPTVLLP